MNKVFKVIWSEARNAYVVVSEMAKSHGTKSCSTKKLLAMLIATGVMTCASMAPAMATNPAPDDKNVTIGKGAVSAPYDKQTGNVAIGENAKAWNGTGRQEAYVDFGQGGIKGGFFGATVKDGTKLPGSIAIGKNTVARSGSTMIGDHGYTGKIGDITIAPDGNGIMKYNNDVYSTTIGANSFNSGALASVTGAFSIASSKYDGSNSFYAVQNTGATIYGSLNSIESATSNSIYSGVASSVLGFANRTQNANAALIWGTGNEVTNSIENIDIETDWNKLSVTDAQKQAIKAMQSSKYAGGSVMAIGGGNKADYATYSELTGVQNKVTGTKAKAAKYDFVNGYQNTVTEASDVTVIGSKNEVTADGNKVIGDNHRVSGKDNVIFGSADQLTETTVNNAVVLGHNAKVTGEGGVALGAGSVADRANAVSVGSTGANRQIINVAAGEADTDAVNVSQLNAVKETANKGWNLSTNGFGTEATNGFGTEATNVKPGDYVDFSGDKNISVSHDGTKVQVELNKNIDVNYVQTNALNAKYNLSVGTANENGTVPFLVSSTGAFYAANNNFSVDKDGKVIATAGEIGNVVLQNGVYTGNSVLRDGELYVGDASGNYSQITTTGAKLGQVTIAADGKISGVAAGEVSKTSTDAINGSQLNQTNENVAALDKRVTQNEADIAQNKADIAQNKADIAQNKADIAQNKADIAQNKADIAQNKADIATNKANIEKNANDIATNKQNIDKLNTRVDGVEKLAKQHTTVTAGDNIAVTETTKKDGGKEYNVALKNKIDLGDKGSVTTDQTVMDKDGLKVGDNVSVSATAVTAGQTSISDEGLAVGPNTSLKADELKVDGKTYIDKNGLNANGMQITNVADGKENSDAVNVGQLKESEKTINNRIDGVENQVVNNTNRINKLGSRVNKVGAGAAALAALHPMDFDPDDKLTFSAGYGNYGGENAAAIGAYYRPDEKVMFSVAGTVGNGENMVNAGVSFALDRTNHVSNSRTALAREVIDLRGQLAVMGAKMAKMEKAFGMLDETKTKLFPDVPANHWAYEYIAKLAGNGYIEGYPDGNFGGDRLMTRYEFAAMLYRAIEKGAALEEKIIKEFEPELGRIRVDRISGEDGDRDKIERVRVNDTKGERDHYGNKLAK